jgi:glyoxylase-like metal-dependent hydrolase (beta-lactamase superfamily II)
MGKTQMIRQNLGKVLVDPDFFLFRPISQYRTNANIVLLRTDPMVFIDTGTRNNPPVRHFREVMDRFHITPEQIKYLIITHDHQDHFQNLQEIQHLVPNMITICHERELRTIRFPFIMSRSWFKGLMYSGMPPWGTYLYGTFFGIFSNLMFQTVQKANRIDAYITKETTLSLHNGWIKMIPLQGHSGGHLTILDSRKNLFLGDFVPFTPWVEPTENGIDLMLQSLEYVLQFSAQQVKRTIRAHGDIRRSDPRLWEISPWAEEKARFQTFYDAIHETLDRIPHVIKGKEVKIQDLTGIFAPHFRRYSLMMRTLFIPPAITWGIAYALKLKAQGLIRSVKSRGKYFWTA